MLKKILMVLSLLWLVGCKSGEDPTETEPAPGQSTTAGVTGTTR